MASSSAMTNLEATTGMATVETLRALSGQVIVIDVRSAEERSASKGGAPIKQSINAPLNVNGQPQSEHVTTAAEFKFTLKASGLAMTEDDNTGTISINFVTHCTAGNTPYVGRGARAAALLRDLGFANSYNGGSVDNIRAALFAK